MLTNWLENLTVFRGMAVKAVRRNISVEQQISLNRIIESTDMYIEKVEAYTETLSEQKALMPTIKAMALQVVESGVLVSDAVEKSIASLSRQNLIITLSILAVALLFGFAYSYFDHPFSDTAAWGANHTRLLHLTGKIAEGNLDISFPDRELTGVYQSMKHMTVKLTQIVNDIVGGSGSGYGWE